MNSSNTWGKAWLVRLGKWLKEWLEGAEPKISVVCRECCGADLGPGFLLFMRLPAAFCAIAPVAPHAHGLLRVLVLHPPSLFFHYFQFCVFFHCQLESCLVSMASWDSSGHIVLGMPTAQAECATHRGSRRPRLALLVPALTAGPRGDTFAMDVYQRG